ncbi:hypothetical protein JCM39068_43410 [Desulfocastanea catecholica]
MTLGTVLGVGSSVVSGLRFKVLLGVARAVGVVSKGDLFVEEDVRDSLVLAFSALLTVEIGRKLGDLLTVFA